MATVVLVCITGVYAYLTYKLVRLQERPMVAIRLAAQESAARSLATSLRPKVHLLAVFRHRFPLDLTKKPSASDFDGRELESLAFELNTATPQLPQPLASLCATAALAVQDASLSLLALATLINTEEREAATANRTWSWDEARKTYLTEVRNKVITKPEWDEIVAGEAISDAIQPLKDLNDRLTEYLLGR